MRKRGSEKGSGQDHTWKVGPIGVQGVGLKSVQVRPPGALPPCWMLGVGGHKDIYLECETDGPSALSLHAAYVDA